MDLNEACRDHDHQGGLPDREMRRHLLAMAIRQVQAELRDHGYADTTRSLEIIEVALHDSIEDSMLYQPLEN